MPLAIALVVYALASRVPGSRSPPMEDRRTAPLSEGELLGPPASPWVVPTLEVRPPEPAPAPPPGPAREAR